MYGYYTQSGYMGMVAGHWMLFVSDDEYYDYIKGESNNER